MDPEVHNHVEFDQTSIINMQFSVEILDHIFSFLVTHRKTLVACSEDPVLSPIVERHLYYHVVVHIGKGKTSNIAFGPDHLSRLVSENPRILYYVKILEVEVAECSRTGQDSDDCRVAEDLCHEFSATLLMFPALECIVLTNQHFLWPSTFRVALADRLKLPTVKEIHVNALNNFHFSSFNNCKNIQNLALSGSFEAEGSISNSPLPLKSLVLFAEPSSYLLAWLKPHINDLQSLKCGMDSVMILPELLRVCSGTLTKLEIDLENSPYFDVYKFKTGTTDPYSFPELSSIPRNLQRLTIRTTLDLDHSNDGTPLYLSSRLPAACKIISLFINSGPPQHLALNINIDLSTSADLPAIDFSPLAVLGAASLSIPRIDLYVSTGVLPPAVTRAQLSSSLEDYEGIVTSIKEGVLVIHLEETAPDCIEGDWALAPTNS